MTNLSITPPLAFQGKPVRSLIDANQQVWLHADDLQAALCTGSLWRFPNLLPEFWVMRLPGDDQAEVLLAMPAVYRLMYLTNPLINPVIAMAFDDWLIAELMPTLLELAEDASRVKDREAT